GAWREPYYDYENRYYFDYW
nr:immunoglobulin heavy chain junction region [Mus musculus]